MHLNAHTVLCGLRYPSVVNVNHACRLYNSLTFYQCEYTNCRICFCWISRMGEYITYGYSYALLILSYWCIHAKYKKTCISSYLVCQLRLFDWDLQYNRAKARNTPSIHTKRLGIGTCTVRRTLRIIYRKVGVAVVDARLFRCKSVP